MPKEVIPARPFGQTTGNDPAPEPSMQVRWGRNGYCQVATVMPDGVPFRTRVGPDANGWYASLDRDGLNRLIRTLRKARDQAFGSDA